MENILKEPEVTYLEKLKYIVSKAGLSEIITITEIESVSFQKGITRIVKLEGKGSHEHKELIEEVKEAAKEIIAIEGMSFDDCWNVSSGPVLGDKLPSFECKTREEKIFEMRFDAGKETLYALIFWTSQASSFESETEFVSLYLQANEKPEKIKLLMINCDDESYATSNLIVEKGWDLIIEQFYADKSIIERLGYNSKSLPITVVLNSVGEILYIGSSHSIDLSLSFRGYMQTNQFEAFFRQNAKEDENSWWAILDEISKMELINEINNSLADVYLDMLNFSVITQSIWHRNEETMYTTPVIIGKLNHENEETLKTFVSDLEETLNFKNLVFEISYLN